jgi:isopentenyl-diphosphate delta-isomerase
MNKEEKVVLVDKSGQALYNSGCILSMPKLEAHKKGIRHLAVSIFLFNSQDQLLLQQRSFTKYHSAGKWSNTCCTHPRTNEEPVEAAQRRLSEEMGMQADIKEAFTFSYMADVGSGLIENEFDHIFIGHTEVEPIPDPAEVCDWIWAVPEQLDQDILNNKIKYAAWFLKLWPELKKYLRLRLDS